MEEEERQQQMLDLELGPRNRKTVKQVGIDVSCHIFSSITLEVVLTVHMSHL